MVAGTRVRNLVQDAQKFSFHRRRSPLSASDVDDALRMEGMEPLYGLSAGKQHVPFRFASGGGRELHFSEEREVDLSELTSAPMPKIPLAPTLRAHWLAIEGVQPSIPENPPAQSKDQVRTAFGTALTNCPIERLSVHFFQESQKVFSLTLYLTALPGVG